MKKRETVSTLAEAEKLAAVWRKDGFRVGICRNGFGAGDYTLRATKKDKTAPKADGE